MSDTIRVVIVEDHALTRTGLRATLGAAGMRVVAEASDGVAGLDTIARERPDVAVVDIGLPGRDGISLTRGIKAEHPGIGVVILTMQDLDRQVRAAVEAGADAYCVKASEPSIVVDAVRTVAAGGAYFDPRIARAALRGLGDDPASKDAGGVLTPRELDVLRLVAEGVGNAEIAQRLHLGLGTVKGHIAEILEKLSASDRAHAAVTAFRRGLLP